MSCNCTNTLGPKIEFFSDFKMFMIQKSLDTTCDLIDLMRTDFQRNKFFFF